MADLLAAARTAASLSRFVEEDLVGLMTQLDIDAAGIALSGLSEASDKRAVYWSAINHLEAAEAKLRSRLTTLAAYDLAQVYLYVSAIKALILRYVGEERLVAKCLGDCLAVAEQQERFERSSARQFKEFVSVFNPAAWVALFRTSKIKKAARDFRPATFWETLGFPGPHRLRLLMISDAARSRYEENYWPPD